MDGEATAVRTGTGLRLALWQTSAGPGDVEGNLARLAAVAAEAAAEGADVLVTPEMFLTGYDIPGPLTRQLAEPADGPLFERVAALSEEHGIAIAYGYPELGEPADGAESAARGAEGSAQGGDAPAQGGEAPVYNAVQVVDGGRSVLRHRKMHLYGDLDRARFAPGDAVPDVAELRGRRISALICYDVEFPESVRAAALAGADLVLVPTANMVGFEEVSTLLVPARALENGVAVAYVNYIGAEAVQRYCGHSVLAVPGRPAVLAGAEDDALLILDVPGTGADAAAGDADYLRDRRGDLFG